MENMDPIPASFLRNIGSQSARRLRAVFEWVGRHETGVLASLLVAAVSILAFVVLADKVVAGKTMRFDEWALRSLRRSDDPSKPIGPVWLGEVARDITALGGVAVLALLTLSIAGFFWLRKMYDAMWLVLLSTLSGLLVSTVLKLLFDRARPQLVPHLSMVFTSSFPSGHSMLSATVFLTLGALLGRFVRERHLQAYFLLLAVI
jgi:undecaprenyl-diphosphatase